MARPPKFTAGSLTANFLIIDLYKKQGSGKACLYKCLCLNCKQEIILSRKQLDRNKLCECTKKCLIKKSKNKVPWNNQLRKSYFSAKTRCSDPKHKNYKYYRNVKFNLTLESLYNCLGNPTLKIHTLDRIDNTKGYVIGNIRWATPTEQQHNRLDNLWYIYNNKKYLAKDLFILLTPPG